MGIKDFYNAAKAKRQLSGMDERYTSRLTRNKLSVPSVGRVNNKIYRSRILGMVKQKDFQGAADYARTESARVSSVKPKSRILQ